MVPAEKDLYQNLSISLRTRLSSFSERDIIDYNEAVIIQFADIFKVVNAAMKTALRNPEDNHALLLVSLRLLETVNLEHNKNGIELLTRFIRDLESEPNKVMEMDTIKFLMENSIVTRLLEIRPQIEILKLSTPLFTFLARHDFLQVKEDALSLAWKSMEGQDAVYVEVLTNVLLDTAKAMQHKPLFELYKKLELSLESPSVTSISRMCKFLVNSAESNDEHIQKLGIAALFAFIDKADRQNPELVTAVRKALYDLLGNEHFAGYRNEVLGKLVVRLGGADRQAAELCRDLLLLLSAKDCSTLIRTYDDGHRLTFLQSVISIITGPNGSLQLLKVLFEILDVTTSKATSSSLSDAEFLNLLQYFAQPTSNLEKHELFFHWITECISANKQVLSIQIFGANFDFLIQEFVPETIPLLSKSVFQCYKRLFLITNAYFGSLSLFEYRVQMWKEETLRGFEVLEYFALYGISEAVRSEATQLLAQLHTRISIPKGKKTCSRFLVRICDALRSEPHGESRTRFLHILSSYILEYDSIVGTLEPPLVSSQYITVAYSFSANEEKALLRLPTNATFGTVRKVISFLHKLPAAETMLSYRQEMITFLEDGRSLAYESSPLHFQVGVNPLKYRLISFHEAIGRRQDLISEFIQLMERETEQGNLPMIWLILTHLVSNFAFKIKVKELGVTFEDLMEGSFFKQLLCLLVLESLQDDREFKANYEKRGTNSVVRALIQKARGEGLVPFITKVNTELSVQYAELMLYVLFNLKETCSIGDGKVYTSCLLDLLYVLSESIPEQYQSKPISLSTCVLSILDSIRTQAPHELEGWVIGHPHFLDLFSNSLISQRSLVFSSGMLALFKRLIAPPYDLGVKIGEICIGHAITAVELPNCSPLYFSFTADLILTDNVHNYDTLYHSLFEKVRGLNPEPQSFDESVGFSGSFMLLEAILKVNPLFASLEETRYVLQICLLDMQESSSKPKCKSYRSRSAAFSLLTTMINILDDNNAFLTYLDVLHNDVTWRKPEIRAWMRDEEYGEKTELGFVGLRNMGNTCYLNAVVQQLYMIQNFRNALLQTESSEQQVLHQLQRLFLGLNRSDKPCLRPKKLCAVYLDFDGKPIDVRQQMDADEFLTGLFSKIDEELKETAHSHLIKDYFNGTFLISCQANCSHGSTRTDMFPSLSISIEDHSSVQQGLESLVATEVLTGDNAYHCTNCDQKVIAERRSLIQVLPKAMFITLKRFRFDRVMQRNVKVNSRCEFPEEIDMAPFTVQKEKKMYKLRGVIIHYGAVDSGHYYSYIYDRNSNQWLRFEDAFVTVSTAQQMKEEGFGTTPEELEKLTFEQLNSLRNAYMLLYEAIEERRDISMRADYRRAESIQELEQEREMLNFRYWKRRRVFSKEYRLFLTSLIETQTDVNFFFAFRYLVTIGLRLRELPIQVIRSFYQNAKNHPEVMNWVLDTMSYEPLLSELILTCPKAISRKLVISLTVKCFSLASEEAKEKFLQSVLAVSHKLPRISTIEYEGYYELLFRLWKANDELQNKRHFFLLAAVSPLLNIQNTCPPALPRELKSGMCLGRINESMPENYPAGKQELSYVYQVALCNLILPSLADIDLDYFNSIDVLTQFIKGAGGKFGANEIANFAYTLLSRVPNSLDLYHQYINVLALAVNESDNTELHTALVQVKAIIKKLDGPSTQYVLDEILSSFEHNLMFVHATEETVLFLSSLCSRNIAAQQWVVQHGDFIGKLRSWKAIYTQWSYENPLSLALDKVFNSVAQYTQFMPRNQVLVGLSQLMDRRYPDLREAVDLDDAVEEGAVTEGSEVEYHYMDFTYRKRVRYNFGTVLYLTDTENQNGFFASVDDDNLMPSRL